jgi:hypothetical protein
MNHVGTAASAVRRPKCIGAQFLWASFLDITHGLCSFDFAQGRLLAAILRSFGDVFTVSGGLREDRLCGGVACGRGNAGRLCLAVR